LLKFQGIKVSDVEDLTEPKSRIEAAVSACFKRVGTEDNQLGSPEPSAVAGLDVNILKH
jgi:hypothetical protein